MANYKLIVSDLDGTLLNEKMEIGEKNDAAICEFARRGILFAPFSGRTRDEIPDTLINSPYVRYLSYSNGAVVYDKAEKKKIISSNSNSLSSTFHIIINHTRINRRNISRLRLRSSSFHINS